MVEMRNGKKVLITPVSAEDLKDIKVGDIVYLDGSMTTCRDVAHRRLVEEGRELLQYTDRSISTISEFLCFSSQSHFHTAFKKQFGMTPSEYRRELSH